MAKIFIKENGDAIINVLRNGVTSLDIDGLESGDIDWARAIISEPGYILDPNQALPQIKLLFINLTDRLGMNARLDCVYEYALYYFRKQTVGEDHQELILQDINNIFELFSDNAAQWRPAEFALIGAGPPEEQQLQSIVPTEVKFYPELRHTIDLPSIRISVAEIRLIVTTISWSNN